jgi:hypothetical protein
MHGNMNLKMIHTGCGTHSAACSMSKMGLVKWLGRESDPLLLRLRKRGGLSLLRHTLCRRGAQFQIRKLYLRYVVYTKETYAKHDLLCVLSISSRC